MTYQACILVGGRGTRLGDFTRNVAKPFLDVGGRPFVDFLVENLARHGIEDIVLLAGHLARDLVLRYDRQNHHGARIRCVVEPEPLGTGGALRFAVDALADSFFLLNGDTFFDINLLDLRASLIGEPEIAAAIALRWVEDARERGTVTLAGNRIVGFAEKAYAGPGLVNGGIYSMRRSVVEHIPTGRTSIEENVFPVLAARGLLLGLAYRRPFVDMGSPDQLVLARNMIPALTRRPTVLLDADLLFRRDGSCLSDGMEALRYLNGIGWRVAALGPHEALSVMPNGGNGLSESIRDRLAAAGAHVDAVVTRLDSLQWSVYCTARAGVSAGNVSPTTGLVRKIDGRGILPAVMQLVPHGQLES